MTDKIPRSPASGAYVDKRRHRRHGLQKNVRLEVDGEVVVGETYDISLSGVSVLSDTHLSNDAFVQMHIDTVGEMTGHVVRETDGGFAVEFDTLIQEEKERLGSYLKSMFSEDEDGNEDDESKPSAAELEKNLKSMFKKD